MLTNYFASTRHKFLLEYVSIKDAFLLKGQLASVTHTWPASLKPTTKRLLKLFNRNAKEEKQKKTREFQFNCITFQASIIRGS